jgi:hypothetical protein
MRENEPLQSGGSVPKCKAIVKDRKYLRHTKAKAN